MDVVWAKKENHQSWRRLEVEVEVTRDRSLYDMVHDRAVPLRRFLSRVNGYESSQKNDTNAIRFLNLLWCHSSSPSLRSNVPKIVIEIKNQYVSTCVCCEVCRGRYRRS